MEHQSLRDFIQAMEAVGVRVVDDFAYATCRRCRRTRRFNALELPHKRIVSLVFCLECLRALQFGTTEKSQIIV